MFKSSARNSNRLEPKNQRIQNRIKNVIPFKKKKKNPCQNFIGRIKFTFNFTKNKIPWQPQISEHRTINSKN